MAEAFPACGRQPRRKYRAGQEWPAYRNILYKQNVGSTAFSREAEGGENETSEFYDLRYVQKERNAL